jgi:single-stranded-DNA-specific exonuclease
MGQAHVRVRLKAGDGAVVSGVAFRAAGRKLGNALMQNRGNTIHAAGTLSIDRWQGAERVQLRISDIAAVTP